MAGRNIREVNDFTSTTILRINPNTIPPARKLFLEHQLQISSNLGRPRIYAIRAIARVGLAVNQNNAIPAMSQRRRAGRPATTSTSIAVRET